MRGDHGLVAHLGFGGVGNANHPAEGHGEVDHGIDVGDSLAGVGIEEICRCFAGENQIELPSQVGGVAQARAHALTGKGWHLVRRIAGNQHRIGPGEVVEGGAEHRADHARQRRHPHGEPPCTRQPPLVEAPTHHAISDVRRAPDVRVTAKVSSTCNRIRVVVAS